MLLDPRLSRALFLSLAIGASACGGSPEEDADGTTTGTTTTGTTTTGTTTAPPNCLESCAGACRLGVCVDAPELLAVLPAGSYGISVEESALIYHTYRPPSGGEPEALTIWRRALDTGADEMVVDLPEGYGVGLIEGEVVYYFTRSPKEIRALDLASGMETVLFSGQVVTDPFLRAGDALLANTLEGLFSVPVGGGAAVPLTGVVEEVAVGGDAIYYLSDTFSEPRHLGGVPLAGGAAEELVTVGGSASVLRVAGGSVYWFDTSNGPILRLPLPAAAGAAPETVCEGFLGDMAIDESAVLVGQADGVVAECPLAGGGRSRVWDGPGVFSVFAMNDPRVATFRDHDTDEIAVYRLPAAP